ncbi:MAG: hypothetical protein ACI9FJ_003233 [Alteromonadaceae bacterium]
MRTFQFSLVAHHLTIRRSRVALAVAGAFELIYDQITHYMHSQTRCYISPVSGKKEPIDLLSRCFLGFIDGIWIMRQRLLFVFALFFTFFTLFTPFSTLAADKGLIPIEDFSKHNQFSNVKISPTGEFLAVSMRRENGKTMIGIVDRKTMGFASTIDLDYKEMPGDFRWVNDTRLVVEVLYVDKFGVRPYWYGELFSVNADGSKREMLVTRRDEGWPSIIDTMPDDPEHVLIVTHKRTGKD